MVVPAGSCASADATSPTDAVPSADATSPPEAAGKHGPGGRRGDDHARHERPAASPGATTRTGHDRTGSTGRSTGPATKHSRGSTTSAPAVTVTSTPGVTAAEKHGWGAPARSDDFDGDLDRWNLYDGPGHAGNGRRSPDAVSARDGVLTITGDSSGTTGGMAWGEGAKYGRWEGRVLAPASDPSYNALLLLWPDAENFPVGGEVDFMEMTDPARQETNMFLHYGADNSQLHGKVGIDATEWHNWAVEWTPDHIVAYVDGQEWFRTTDTSVLPPGPMHLTIQLDWFPKGGSVRPSAMHVDWVRYYPLTDNG
ncbi:family 16 glycosylhydrolase [Pseudonocardia sp. C8]|uniref:glycoside hydrolase family 16 protein n=1 Tax=Pseudonocardia sp. C8 TaxID=2762759 RepID=UPI0016425AE0|nr:glycoside hydrolase family 16 protein [Pseudonocardia sp. C8]MBC3194309.1 family 16 glycosylhydrolase [Pseudonocardia sp. C8]